MKKKIWIPIVAGVVLFAIFSVPVPRESLDDGGTREYTALTYKIVDWNRITDGGNGVYDEIKVYFFPDNLRSVDELWGEEEEKAEHTFVATVLEINGDFVTVQPVENSTVLISCDRVSFGTSQLEKLGVEVGSVVEVTYKGGVMESYPAQVNATCWRMSVDLGHLDYNGQWLDKATAERCDNDIFSDIVITKIYSDCFFARTVIPMPYEIKLNGKLSEEWCVGDQVVCTYKNTYYDAAAERVEADMLTVEASDWQPDPFVAYKPVIYLYPEKETDVTVKLDLDGSLTCTYPAYNGGWTVTASPDGTLTDEAGQTYRYLYWEGDLCAQYELSEGFCVKGEDTAAFLEDALERLGLSRGEANEFIVYWLPLMEENSYNIISFCTDVYTEAARLEVSPAPDTMIRVFMTWQASETAVDLAKQELTAPERSGFTVVEWGGARVE